MSSKCSCCRFPMADLAICNSSYTLSSYLQHTFCNSSFLASIVVDSCVHIRCFSAICCSSCLFFNFNFNYCSINKTTNCGTSIKLVILPLLVYVKLLNDGNAILNIPYYYPKLLFYPHAEETDIHV